MPIYTIPDHPESARVLTAALSREDGGANVANLTIQPGGEVAAFPHTLEPAAQTF